MVLMLERMDRGGLSLGWKADCLVTSRNFSKDHVDVEVLDDQKGVRWRLIDFYCLSYNNDRERTWNLLRNLGRSQSIHCILSGDFN